MDQEFGLIVIGDEILKGMRRDRHFEAFRQMLGKRGMTLAWLGVTRVLVSGQRLESTPVLCGRGLP